MDGPGFTLFQGGTSINVDCQNIEEEEDLEDRRRRAAELGNQLENAFDDLALDDELDNTVDNTEYQSNFNISMNGEIALGNSFKQYSIKYNQMKDRILSQEDECKDGDKPDLNTVIYQLKMEVQSKTRELDYVNKMLIEERQCFNTKINEMSKKLSLSEAERERAIMAKGQTHELLVESKTKISDLEACVQSLKEKNKNLENSKSELVLEMDNVKTVMSDFQLRCRMMEKDISRGSHKRDDAAFKHLTERNSGHIEMMQQQIDGLRSKLDSTETEFRTLQSRYMELQKSKEAIMLEKAETINTLNKRLEEVQNQCQDLLVRKESDHETSRLKKKILSLEDHIEHLQKTVNDLLKQLETKLASENSTEKNSGLCKDLDELKRLSDKVCEQEKQIQRLKREENNNLIKFNEKESEISKLCQKIRVLESVQEQAQKKDESNSKEKDQSKDKCLELEKINKTLSESNAELKQMNQKFVSLRQEDQKTIHELCEDLKQCKSKKAKLEACIKELESDFEKVKSDFEQRKKDLEAKFQSEKATFTDLSNSCLKCMQQMNDITKLEIKNMQLQNDCFTHLKEIKALRAASTNTVNDERPEIERKDASTSPQEEAKKECRDVSVMVNDLWDNLKRDNLELDIDTSFRRKKVAKRDAQVIEEYAKLSARELKSMEERFRAQLINSQKLLISTTDELDQLQNRYREDIEKLKIAILSERDTYESLLTDKEGMINNLVLQIKNHAKKDSYKEEVERMFNELKDKILEMEAERKSMKLLQRQLQDERNQLLKCEKELKQKVEQLTESYRSAKKTAENYKRYTEEKDAFMDREYQKLKDQYHSAFLRIKQKYENFKKKHKISTGANSASPT